MKTNWSSAFIIMATSVLGAFANVKHKLKLNMSLKAQQVEVIENLHNGSDTLCVLPTGYGKTAVFMLFPLIMDEVKLYYLELGAYAHI